MHGIETLKKRINGGELVIGVSVPLVTRADNLKKIWEYDDYGFISTDSQHGAFNEERLVEFCNAADGFGIPVIFRIKHTYLTFLVGNLLDLGCLIRILQCVQKEYAPGHAPGRLLLLSLHLILMLLQLS